jgi:hypothetical protein
VGLDGPGDLNGFFHRLPIGPALGLVALHPPPHLGILGYAGGDVAPFPAGNPFGQALGVAALAAAASAGDEGGVNASIFIWIQKNFLLGARGRIIFMWGDIPSTR